MSIQWQHHDSTAAPIDTPWGEAQSSYEIEPGVVWYVTASHGGIMVRESVAREKLSRAARKHADKWRGAYWYEEDCDISIPLAERPDWNAACFNVDRTALAEGLLQWNKQYVEDFYRERLRGRKEVAA